MNETKNRIVLVTGASGFIGRNLATHFTSQGYTVRCLVRSPEKVKAFFPHVEVFRGILPNDIEAMSFDRVETVVHCAYSTRSRSLEQARHDNEEGTRQILRLSRAAGVQRIVFLSSLSAHEGARSYYGRSKLALEKLFDPKNDLIVRAGLVLGSGEAGLFRRIITPILKYRIVPLLDNGTQMVQTIHIDDLCSALSSALEKNFSGVISLADPVGISMSEFLRLIAERFGRRTFFLPLPSTPVLYTVKLLESLRIPTPISSENILGLQNIRFVDTRPDLMKLGIRLLTPRESIDRIM